MFVVAVGYEECLLPGGTVVTMYNSLGEAIMKRYNGLSFALINSHTYSSPPEYGSASGD